MGKGRRNQRNPDYYQAVEDRDIGRASRWKRSLSRLGGLGRRLLAAAESGVRWAGHMLEVARGTKREE
jgi:hypothetical protein